MFSNRHSSFFINISVHLISFQFSGFYSYILISFKIYCSVFCTMVVIIVIAFVNLNVKRKQSIEVSRT